MQTVDRAIDDLGLRVRLLGPMAVEGAAGSIALPKSRKARALLGYLSLAPRPVLRSRLCELLWDGPSDPRGELRWCLSRLRGVLDSAARHRVLAQGDRVHLDLSDCKVDVLEIGQVAPGELRAMDIARLRERAELFRGELLEDLSLDDCPLFSQWLGAERRRLRTLQAETLHAIVDALDEHSMEMLERLSAWLAINPFEHSAHERLVRALLRQGRMREAEEHLAATIRLYESEGLDWMPIREAWRTAKSATAASTPRRPLGMSAKPVSLAKATSTAAESSPSGSSQPRPGVAATQRASICIMPFLEQGSEGAVRSRLGDGLADDIITRLAKLRFLFVIARGTAFALGDRNMEPEEAARVLGVDYVVGGTVRRRNGRLAVSVELCETQQAHVVWADELECAEADALGDLDRLGDGIVASIAEEIETAERHRAILKPPASLNAWEAYHRGLWHLYRFNAQDNDRAEHFLRMSARLDPTFARAHAGVSFAHFQNAFLLRPQERARQVELALQSAGQSLMADDRDPAAHLAMGRALWLSGDCAGALTEVGCAVSLSPNFALGHYTRGFLLAQAGDPQTAIDCVDLSRALSPFDPLLFAMLGTQAIALLRLGRYADAAVVGRKAAARPNAHAHALAIAAQCLALDGQIDDARALAARIRTTYPNYGIGELFAGLRLSADVQAIFRAGAKRIGLDR